MMLLIALGVVNAGDGAFVGVVGSCCDSQKSTTAFV